ncbi:hypothetical protein Cgig2_018542 [Carnegiea gigantea]|uniref:Uncharacterized protein n=1 Tax=Carnegiea gigantea TaxID=171969 RepID=A0A9Q1KJK1_9CARY|nr:hypothetical protein Cgig2_018542 [Carnegiea gigantea]
MYSIERGTGMEEVRRMKLWYNLKYDRRMVMAVEGDADVRMFFKGNEKCEYFYMGESDEPKRQAQKEGASYEGRTWSCDHGVVYGADDLKGQMRWLRLGGRIVELSDDDENSVTLDNVGDEDTPTKGGDEGSKGSGGDERNNENESVWPRSGLQA